MPTKSASDDGDLESEIAHAGEIVEDIDKLVVNLVEFLEAHNDTFVEKQPEIAAALQEPIAQESLSDSFEELLVELDEVDQWSEEDLLAVAAHAILLALTLTNEGDTDGSNSGREERSELRGDGDDGTGGD